MQHTKHLRFSWGIRSIIIIITLIAYLFRKKLSLRVWKFILIDRCQTSHLLLSPTTWVSWTRTSFYSKSGCSMLQSFDIVWPTKGKETFWGGNGIAWTIAAMILTAGLFQGVACAFSTTVFFVLQKLIDAWELHHRFGHCQVRKIIQTSATVWIKWWLPYSRIRFCLVMFFFVFFCFMSIMACCKYGHPLPDDGRFLICVSCQNSYHLGKACPGIADGAHFRNGHGSKRKLESPHLP